MMLNTLEAQLETELYGAGPVRIERMQKRSAGDAIGSTTLEPGGVHGAGAQLDRKTHGLSFMFGIVAPPQCPRNPDWQHARPALHSADVAQLAPRTFLRASTRGVARTLDVLVAAATDAVGSPATVRGAALASATVGDELAAGVSVGCP